MAEVPAIDQLFPPGTDIRHIYSTLAAYHLYRRTAHSNLTHRRRKVFYALPLFQQEVLSAPPISYPKTLDLIDRAIEHNSELAESIFRFSIDAFGVDPELLHTKEWLHLATGEDVDKVRSTLKQFLRDWSAEGAEERAVCYGPVMKEVERRYGQLGEDKWKISILVPGAGLGRLAFDLAVEGYTSKGNEYSFFPLMASNYILNHTERAEQHKLYPWIHSFSNYRERAAQVRAVSVPDVHPGSLLSGAQDRFSMDAGEFVAAYNTEESRGTYNSVATVFFIDTAVNLFEYLETIWNVLVPGGSWINYGPLLWHWENKDAPAGEQAGVELSLDEVLLVIERVGFKIERRERGERGEYIGSGGGTMLESRYEGEFWVAVKPTEVQPEDGGDHEE